MKLTTKLLGILVFFLLKSTIYSQENLDCELNFKKALFYLEGDDNFPRDSLRSVSLLKPCVKNGDSKAQLLMARLLEAKNNEKSFKKAFKLYKKSAKQGNAIAMTDLARMFKYGIGCNLNFNKARKWYKKAATLKNDKATYSLGYLYLKGLGNIEQNYEKAVGYFKKSNHPMAKYWLGKCYYHGYGVLKDIAKANRLLGTNFAIENTQNTTSDTSHTNSGTTTTASDSTQNNVEETINIIGKWQGNILKMDWSGKHIENKQPVTLEFTLEEDTHDIYYNLQMGAQSLTGNMVKNGNAIAFEDTQISMPHESFKEHIPDEISYKLLDAKITRKHLEDNEYLVFNTESYITEWNEPGAPLVVVLQKVTTFSNTNEAIDDTILQSLSNQNDNFIKLYPNPFKNDLIIAYNLSTAATTTVYITDINTNETSIVKRIGHQKKGNYNYFFDGQQLKKGIYVVTVEVNNTKHTRLIIKN